MEDFLALSFIVIAIIICVYKRSLTLLALFVGLELGIFLILFLVDLKHDNTLRLMMEVIGSIVFYAVIPVVFIIIGLARKKIAGWQ